MHRRVVTHLRYRWYSDSSMLVLAVSALAMFKQSAALVAVVIRLTSWTATESSRASEWSLLPHGPCGACVKRWCTVSTCRGQWTSSFSPKMPARTEQYTKHV